jgi:hypothetical protein
MGFLKFIKNVMNNQILQMYAVKLLLARRGFVYYTVIGLLCTLIIFLSFIVLDKRRNKAVEKQIENFSISLMQEIYQLKKKIKVLEEEILIGQDKHYFSNRTSVEYDKDKILSLYEEGLSLREIETLTNLSSSKINEILNSE